MLGKAKQMIRSVLAFLRLDLTKNLEYDRLTRVILKNLLRSDSNTIDVGCHKGEILEMMLQFAPEGKHFAFEPIPEMYVHLVKRFGDNTIVLPYALGDHNGITSFHVVKNAPAYSGIKKREYAVAHPEIEEIEVQVRKLDDLIPPHLKIDCLKIDVEGGEFHVLKGAATLLKRSCPHVIFECGLGASEYYGTQPGSLFDFFEKETGLTVSTLSDFRKSKKPLQKAEFERLYLSKKEYYFIAHPREGRVKSF